MKKTKRRVSNCCQENQGVKCAGKYTLDFDNNIPIFVCDTCGHKNITWKKFFEEYLQLYKVRENWDDPKNAVSCILGVFCHCYKDFFGIDYTFIPKNPNPYGIKECKDAWILLASFNKNIHEVRKYIVWLFSKGLNKKAAITNFGYILTPAIIQKYKLYASKKNTLTRASRLPESFIEYCRHNHPDIFSSFTLDTMNDLGGLIAQVKFQKQTDGMEIKVLQAAEQMGLIKDGRLNFGEKNEDTHRE